MQLRAKARRILLYELTQSELVVAVNIIHHGLGIDITNASESAADSPQVTARISLSEVRDYPEHGIRGGTFQELECLAHRHTRRYFHDHVYMIVAYCKAYGSHSVPPRNLHQDIPTQVFMLAPAKYLISAFCNPPEVVCRFAIAVAKGMHCFISLRMAG